MSEPDQILAQQANQSIALMQAIGQNTQRAFENRFRVQAAQMATGIQVAGQIEEYRMNDARLAELSQTMRIRDQEFQWKKADQAFTEKIRPLEFQMRQFDFQNKFRAQAEQRMSPFLTDIKGEFQQLIMDRPDLAADAQAIYAKTIDSVVNKTLVDPNADIATELEINKGELRKWINKNKTVLGEDRPKIGGMLGAGIDAANKLLGATFDPLSIVKSKEKSAPLSKDQSSRAASIYSNTFGGVPQDFLRKHDPLFSSSTDSSYRIMMATGQLTSQEDYNNLTTEQQAAVASRIENKQKGTLMKDTLEEMQKEIDNYVDNNAKSGGAYSELIDRLRKERNDLQKVYQKEILGIKIEDPQIDPNAKKLPTKEQVLRSIPSGADPAIASSQSAALKDMLSSDFSNVESIIKDVSAVDDAELQDIKNRYISNPDSVKSSDIEKLISKSTPDRIESLANADWFKNYIDENNLDITGSGERAQQTKLGRAMQILTSEARPFMEDIFSPSPKRIFTNKRDRVWSDQEKNEARKVLKSELPKILFDYLNQNR